MKHRGYRALLLVLPRAFRDEFTEEMVAVFADQRTRAHGAGVIGLWLATILEIVALSARLRFDQLRTDLRHSVRSLLRQKTFTLTAVTTLALALGPMTAVMSLVNGVLLNPLPGAKDLDRVVTAYSESPERNRHEFPWSELNFVDHRARKQGLSAFGAFVPTSATIGGDVPQQVEGAWVSEDMFDVLGISVARGRPFTAADMQPGAPPTLILGHDFARARFSGRRCRRSIADGRRPIDGDHRRPSRGIPFPRRRRQFLAATHDRSGPKHAQPNLPAHDGPARRRRDDRHRRAAHEPGRRRSRKAVSGQQRRLSRCGEAGRGAADAQRAPDHHRARPGGDRDLPARLHQHRQPGRRSHRRAPVRVLRAHGAWRQRRAGCPDSC